MIIINALYIKINSDRSSIYSNKLRTAVMIVMATMKWGRVVHAPAVGLATKSGGSLVPSLSVSSMTTGGVLEAESVGAVWLLSSVGLETVGKKVGVAVLVTSLSSQTSFAPLPEYESPEPSLMSSVTAGT